MSHILIDFIYIFLPTSIKYLFIFNTIRSNLIRIFFLVYFFLIIIITRIKEDHNQLTKNASKKIVFFFVLFNDFLNNLKKNE